MIDFGKVKPGVTLYIPFATFQASDGAPVTMTGFAVTDIEIYKNGGTTQRASTTGFGLLDTDGIDFDGTTGLHGFSIALSSNATAGFFTAGAFYWVIVNGITVDGQSITNLIACTFWIGYDGAILDTTIATLSTQQGFTLADGPADNDALNGCVAVVHDVASGVQMAIGVVSDYVGSTKTVSLGYDPGIFTMAAGDNISFFPPSNVTAWRGTQPNALTSGRVEVLLGAVTAGVIAAASFASGALDAVWSVAARTVTAATNITSTGGTTVPQTGDSYARIGAPVGASISADIAAVLAAGAARLAKVKAYFQLLVRKDAAIASDAATELGELNNDEGSGGGAYDNTAESQEALRDRGDAAWTTGGGGSISDILHVSAVIPFSIDLANTATVRIGLMLVNALDDLPSTAEITPGTITIERKAIGGTSWSAVVSAAACSEQAGMIYYDEVFDAGSGYAEGDSIRVTFKSQKITVSANDYEITDANGVIFQTSIRQTMRGTASAALATALATAQSDLDKLTGADGATLASSQPNYGPAKAGDQMDLVGSPNGTAVTAIQSGLATASALSSVASAISSLASSLSTTDGKVDAVKTIIDELGATAAARLALSLTASPTGTVDSGFTPTTTEFEADDITEATADHYIGRTILFTSGALLGQMTDITDYAKSGSNGHFTVTAMTEAPANNDTFIIL